jgi:hypothetical protein
MKIYVMTVLVILIWDYKCHPFLYVVGQTYKLFNFD